jgi:hypothetical protein
LNFVKEQVLRPIRRRLVLGPQAQDSFQPDQLQQGMVERRVQNVLRGNPLAGMTPTGGDGQIASPVYDFRMVCLDDLYFTLDYGG